MAISKEVSSCLAFLKKGRKGGSILLAALVFSRIALADIDIAEYETKSALRDRKSQEKYLTQIEIDKAREARNEEQAIQAAQREEEERRRAEMLRPWPARLTEQRCTLCHPAVNFTRGAHALPGWWAVVLRMIYVNKAPISWDEAQIIAPHLAEQWPADGGDAAMEWLLFAGLICSPVVLLGAGIMARRAIQRKMK